MAYTDPGYDRTDENYGRIRRASTEGGLKWIESNRGGNFNTPTSRGFFRDGRMITGVDARDHLLGSHGGTDMG